MFGEIRDGQVLFSGPGRLLANFWARTAGDGRLPPEYDFVAMTNHVHGIVWLPRIRPSVRWPIAVDARPTVGEDPIVGARRPFDRDVVPASDDVAVERRLFDNMDASPLPQIDNEPAMANRTMPVSLGDMVGAFKSMVTTKINRATGQVASYGSAVTTNVLYATSAN